MSEKIMSASNSARTIRKNFAVGQTLDSFALVCLETQIQQALESQAKLYEGQIVELSSLVDGASVVVKLWKAESPAQIEWKKNWLDKALANLAEFRKGLNHE